MRWKLTSPLAKLVQAGICLRQADKAGSHTYVEIVQQHFNC